MKACFMDSSTNPNKRILRIEFDKDDAKEKWLKMQIETILGIKVISHRYSG